MLVAIETRGKASGRLRMAVISTSQEAETILDIQGANDSEAVRLKNRGEEVARRSLFPGGSDRTSRAVYRLGSFSRDWALARRHWFAFR